MPRTKKKKQGKQKIISELKISKNDTGSIEVQVGLLTKGIEELNEHLKKHIHDFSSRRGLLKKVSQRRKFLKYLQVHNPDGYEKLIKKIKKID